MAHKITANDQWFINMHRRDPLQGREFVLGDHVVVCLDCRCVQTADSWEFSGNKCVNCGKTRSTSDFSREFIDFNYRKNTAGGRKIAINAHNRSMSGNINNGYLSAGVILLILAVIAIIFLSVGHTQTPELTTENQAYEDVMRPAEEDTGAAQEEAERQETEKEEYIAEAPASTNSAYILDSSSSKYYSYDELNRLDDDTLQMAINEIYAKHGRKFNTPSIQEYFDNQTWYHGTIEPSEIDGKESYYFNQYELENCKRMVRIRDERANK